MGRPNGGNPLSIDSDCPIVGQNSYEGRMGNQLAVPFVHVEAHLSGGEAELVGIVVPEVPCLFLIAERP